MKIFLAGENGKSKIIPIVHGGGTGFPEPFRRIKEMKLYLAEGESRHWLQAPLIEEKMKIYLAGVAPWRDGGGYDPIIKKHKPYILESFYYANDDTERLLPLFGDFLLDSGAFTFMQASKSHVKWEEYIERYADFINRNKVEKFFELDIDSIVGYDKVLEFRKKLEKLTNKPVIPVWHISRGIDNFYKMCDEYSYVALGGIVGERRSGTKYKQYHAAFPHFINEAHKRNAKIHGLGYTDLNGLTVNHFDSVDSTAWTTGNRFGFVYQFNGKTMIKHDVPKGKRLADSRKVALINYTEWIKFQKYAEKHL